MPSKLGTPSGKNVLKGGQGHAQSATGAPANTSSGVAVARVLAGPVWLAGEEPMDIHKTFEFAEDCITPYDQLTEPLVLDNEFKQNES